MTDDLKVEMLKKMAGTKTQHYFFLNGGNSGKVQARILNVSEDTRSFEVLLAGYPESNGRFVVSFDSIIALPITE